MNESDNSEGGAGSPDSAALPNPAVPRRAPETARPPSTIRLAVPKATVLIRPPLLTPNIQLGPSLTVPSSEEKTQRPTLPNPGSPLGAQGQFPRKTVIVNSRMPSARHSALPDPETPPGSSGGFTLIELLIVIGIIAALTAIMIPATSGLLGSNGRKGAVANIMGTLEQARVAALESGATTYLVFWKRSFPQQDAFMVVREGTEADANAAGTIPPLVFLTGWRKVPQGVILHNVQGKSVMEVMPDGLKNEINAGTKLPSSPAITDLAAIEFNGFGQIQDPKNPDSLNIFIASGTRDAAGKQQLRAASDDDLTLVDQMTLSRFTGRALLVSGVPVIN